MGRKTFVSLWYDEIFVVTYSCCGHARRGLLVYDAGPYVENAKCVFESTIKVYELLGAEVYLYFDLAEFPITARVDSRTTARPGDTVKFAFDVEKIHVFDKETEQTITN